MAALKVLVKPEEYLARERMADTKSEYISGEILAMVGATLPHNMICTDVARALGNHLEEAGGTCDVFNSDQRVRITDTGPFFYPDTTVVCGTPIVDSDSCLRNPVLIVEVLSESSSDYDQGEKFRHYRQFPTLRHYILIEQDRMRVEHYQQVEGVLWTRVGEYIQPQDRIFLPDLGIELPVSEIYRRINF